MKNAVKFAAVAAVAFVVAGGASASTIRIDTAQSNLGAQSSAAGYKSAVESALAYGAKSTVVSSYDNLSAQSLLGAYTNYAYQSTVNFGVSAANAGVWEFRTGVDFGNGGAVYVDGVAYDYKTNDMWWAGNYNHASQFFDVSLSLNEGNHTVSVYGLENCCSGNYQGQFKIGSGAFTSFSATDGLITAAVPEPESYAMLLAGLGMLGFMARRKGGQRA